ncbi:hypothetical protein LJK88_00150 [Paenibacillus sp. P26]|nr:hypothetical protein LJK88_00150 [Paenibacillus sp. P26]
MARCIRSAGLRDISLPYGIPQRGGIVHYDWLSVFFIGILYAGCLGFAPLTSTGIIGEVRHWVGQVESTVDIPQLQEPVGPGVKRIVVQTSGQQVKLEKSEEPVVHLFGTYRTRTARRRYRKGTGERKPIYDPYDWGHDVFTNQRAAYRQRYSLVPDLCQRDDRTAGRSEDGVAGSR